MNGTPDETKHLFRMAVRRYCGHPRVILRRRKVLVKLMPRLLVVGRWRQTQCAVLVLGLDEANRVTSMASPRPDKKEWALMLACIHNKALFPEITFQTRMHMHDYRIPNLVISPNIYFNLMRV